MQLEYNPYTNSDSITSQYCKLLKDNKDICIVCDQIEANGQQWDK